MGVVGGGRTPLSPPVLCIYTIFPQEPYFSPTDPDIYTARIMTFGKIQRQEIWAENIIILTYDSQIDHDV